MEWSSLITDNHAPHLVVVAADNLFIFIRFTATGCGFSFVSNPDVFPRLVPIAYFPALGISCKCNCGWQTWQHSYFFSRCHLVFTFSQFLQFALHISLQILVDCVIVLMACDKTVVNLLVFPHSNAKS